MELPESWRFLGTMWWVLHVIAIGLVFYIGYVIGRSSAAEGGDEPQEPWHAREAKKSGSRGEGDASDAPGDSPEN